MDFHITNGIRPPKAGTWTDTIKWLLIVGVPAQACVPMVLMGQYTNTTLAFMVVYAQIIVAVANPKITAITTTTVGVTDNTDLIGTRYIVQGVNGPESTNV